MTTTNDLPQAAVVRITQLARHRVIAGTNKYARVCRQWRDASISEDLEPLQLFMDLRHTAGLSNRVSSWMVVHGQQVEVLVVEADTACRRRLEWCNKPLDEVIRLEAAGGTAAAGLVATSSSPAHLPPAVGG